MAKNLVVRNSKVKAVVTQDNRLVYAKYDLSTNELKLFMWILSKINSIQDMELKDCKMPLSEVMQIFGGESRNFAYVKNLVDIISKKTYVEDFKLLDETTMKEVGIYRAMPLFQYIEYREGNSFITYRLNQSLVSYVLQLTEKFTQVKFKYIQDMKSAYAIRIYNMLYSELRQNRVTLKIQVAVLQNILGVPQNYADRWADFKRNVLDKAQQDINLQSNIVLHNMEFLKTSRKITEIVFHFDYKDANICKKREEKKKLIANNKYITQIEKFIGKEVYVEGFGIVHCDSWRYSDEKNVEIVFIFKDGRRGFAPVRNNKDIENFKKGFKIAQDIFYSKKENLANLQTNRELSKKLFNK